MKYIRPTKTGFLVENISAINIARKFKTPFYCYSLSQLKSNYNNFKKSFKKIAPLICFSVKSNSNLVLLKELKKLGSGADVVSIGELVKSLKAGISKNKIVFSGVGKTKEELIFAINKGILLINVESESELILINELSKKFRKKTSIGIRLNPNVDALTHKKISTGKKDDKFGLTYKNFINLVKKINRFKNIKLDAISVHIGSQINSVIPFQKTLKLLDQIINNYQFSLKYVDLGGGIGIAYSKKEKQMNLNKYIKFVSDFYKKNNCKIILEPGRLIAANAAILISKIIYIKNSNNKKFIILDVGMNDFMRPALYDAKHNIFPLIKNNKKFNSKIEFVGPVCESTDKFLKLNNFQKINENDYICITDVGAYGSSLSSNYNLRPSISEILIDGSKIKIIKKRQNLQNLIRQ